jgi:LuxR family maltose regulon positive regulatory protein
MKARIEAELGDLAAADRWAGSTGLTTDDELSYVREFEHTTLARVLLARGTADDTDRAIRLLERLRTAAEDGGRAGSAIEILVHLALAYGLAGRNDEARAALLDALDRAGAEGYVRTFLDAGPVIMDLLRSLDGTGAGPAARVLATAPGTESRPRPRSADPDELSDRELDVLRLLRSDLSGPDIARELHVSLNTLRTHTKHIYTKLGATNRREAVTRSAELSL